MQSWFKQCEHEKQAQEQPKAAPEPPNEPPKEPPPACDAHKIDWGKQPNLSLSAPTRNLLWEVAYAYKFGYTQKPGQWWMNSGQRDLSKYTYCIAAALMLNGQCVKIVNNYRRGNHRSLVEYFADYHNAGVWTFKSYMVMNRNPSK